MKLFTKYSRINMAATIIIFLIASFAYYALLNFVLITQIDDDLVIEEGEIISYVRKFDRKPESISVRDQQILYRPIPGPRNTRQFSSIDLSDGEEKKEGYRQLLFDIKAGGQWYEVKVLKSLEDIDDLIGSILLITLGTILLILTVSYFINHIVLKRIWKPFYNSLALVREFRIGKDDRLRLPPGQVDEFRFMNETLERITSQAQLEYISLKTFSENASHELQTPIAIIRSKLDLLIQDEHLTETQSQALNAAYNALERLTRLNHSLLLLARIENRQYAEVQAINFRQRLEEKLSDFSELWYSHQVTVHPHLKSSTLLMNRELADILLNNLLSNATRHNYPGGSIRIELNQQHLSITNTSREPALAHDRIFQRFYKPSQGNEHNGLGLSIIWQICEASGFQIEYGYLLNVHRFLIHFPVQ